MTFEEISKNLAELVKKHEDHTKLLIEFYEKSLAAQVEAYTQEIEKEHEKAKENMAKLEQTIKKSGGIT